MFTSQLKAYASGLDTWMPFNLAEYKAVRAETAYEGQPYTYREGEIIDSLANDGYLTRYNDLGLMAVTDSFLSVVGNYRKP